MALTSLPPDMLSELVLSLRGVDLLNLCQSNRSLRNFCTEALWQQKTLLDFSHSVKPPNLSWAQYYIRLSANTIKRLNVAIWKHIDLPPLSHAPWPARGVERTILGPLWITKENTLNDIISRAIDLYHITFRNDYITLRLVSDDDRELSINDFGTRNVQILDFDNLSQLHVDPSILSVPITLDFWDSLDTILFTPPDPNPLTYS